MASTAAYAQGQYYYADLGQKPFWLETNWDRSQLGKKRLGRRLLEPEVTKTRSHLNQRLSEPQTTWAKSEGGKEFVWTRRPPGPEVDGGKGHRNHH